MEDTNSLIEQRRAKLKALEAKGVFPFKNKFTPGLGAGEARAKFEAGELAEHAKVSVAGRITAHRDMGKSMFIDVRDQGGRIQCYAQKNTLGEDLFHTFTQLDLGDFVGVTGALFRTKTNEPTIKLEAFTILAKALRPPPAKWHGLEDTEIRYRQRYLDLIANEDVRKIFKQRSDIVHEIRQFFHARGYMEVETPTMQPIPGGAAARPFITKYEALGCNFYLRIALELYHKRLLVGGIDKLFEIGKNFRNEGLSRRHNPEFTMLEAYCAFGDYATMMETVESLITTVAQKVNGKLQVWHPKTSEIRNALNQTKIFLKTDCQRLFEFVDKEKLLDVTNLLKPLETKIEQAEKSLSTDHPEFHASVAQKFGDSLLEFRDLLFRVFSDNEEVDYLRRRFDVLTANFYELGKDKIIDLTPPWRRVKYKDLVRETVEQKTKSRIPDWFALTPEERRSAAVEELKLEGDIGKDFEDFEVTNAVFSKFIEPTLIQPTFVTHLPKELVPLAKLSPDDPTTVEVFECCINGQEISPGYTEQNDPIAQRATLEHQAGGEQQKLDEDFLVALEHGMPPAGGIGIGIDRLCMMLLGQESIRDVILFPQLKPK